MKNSEKPKFGEYFQRQEEFVKKQNFKSFRWRTALEPYNASDTERMFRERSNLSKDKYLSEEEHAYVLYVQQQLKNNSCDKNLSIHTAHINLQDESGNTALHYAIKGRLLAPDQYPPNIPLALALLEAGADFTLTNEYSATALHYLCQYKNSIDDTANQKKYIDALKAKGADLNAKDNKGKTPLHDISVTANQEIVRYLVDQGADINAKDNAGSTPLNLLCEWAKNIELIQYLVESKGANINNTMNNGNTLLHSAANSEIAEISEYLIQKNLDPNSNNKDNETPLHKLCDNVSENNVAIAEVLINGGADINAKDTFGNTPLISAIMTNNTQLVAHLIQKGADLKIKNNDGKNAEDIMAENQYDNKNIKIALNCAEIKNTDPNIVENIFDVKEIAVEKMVDCASSNQCTPEELPQALWDNISPLVINDETDDKAKEMLETVFKDAAEELVKDIEKIPEERKEALKSIFSKLWDNFLRAVSYIFNCKLDYASKAVVKKTQGFYQNFLQQFGGNKDNNRGL